MVQAQGLYFPIEMRWFVNQAGGNDPNPRMLPGTIRYFYSVHWHVFIRLKCTGKSNISPVAWVDRKTELWIQFLYCSDLRDWIIWLLLNPPHRHRILFPEPVLRRPSIIFQDRSLSVLLFSCSHSYVWHPLLKQLGIYHRILLYTI